jgi:predicted nucleotidyltransferase
MNRSDALRVLARAKPELEKRFGVVRLVLFGSMTRDEVRPDSDVDVMGYSGDTILISD